MKYQAAVDLSTPCGCFALAANGEIVLDIARPLTGRESALLPEWIEENLRRAGVSLRDIAEWTVGSGPGSFSGMRLAAAWVEGVAFGKAEVKTRCVPSAASYIGQANFTTPKAGIIYDGRNHEILFFGAEKSASGYRPDGTELVLNRENAAEFFAGFQGECAIARRDFEQAAKVFLPEHVRIVENLRAGDLLRETDFPFDNDLAKLVYVRPAVHPKE